MFCDWAAGNSGEDQIRNKIVKFLKRVTVVGFQVVKAKPCTEPSVRELNFFVI